MDYQPMLPVVDEWVLWVLVLITPLLGLVSLTAFIVLHRERKTATPTKHRLNLIRASSSAVLILFILGFMLFSGLRIDANKANTAENHGLSVGPSSAAEQTPTGR
jgi:hypothetical protein